MFGKCIALLVAKEKKLLVVYLQSMVQCVKSYQYSADNNYCQRCFTSFDNVAFFILLGSLQWPSWVSEKWHKH